jgi:ketosteroid isomerase-like protein
MAEESRGEPMMELAELVRAYIAAVERFDAGAAGPLLHEGVVQTEHPNLLVPSGRRRRKAEMLADLENGAMLLRRQSFVIASLVAADDRVAVEARWEGELAVPIRALEPGAKIAAHVAMTFRIEGRHIIEQANYDCFEPF